MRRGIAALAIVLAVAGERGDAQEKKPPVFASDVSFVLLPVFVVGADGRAARGLSADDFEIHEDGKRVPVASFRYVDTTSEEDQDAIRESSPARRRFLLLFDKSFTDVAGLRRAQHAASDFVRRRLAESDLAAVATFDVNKGMKLVANFTEDRALLVHAVETLGAPQLSRITDPLALAADLAILDTMVTGTQGGGSTQLDTGGLLTVLVNRLRAAEVQAYRANVMTLIGSMQDLARALRGVDGRKQILYLSSGFDSRLLVGQSGEEQRLSAQSTAAGRLWEVDGTTRFGDAGLRDGLMEMTRALTSADAVVHTVDVSGFGRDNSLIQQSITVDPQRDVGGRDALSLIAAETGGRFFKDANDLVPALGEMLDMTSRYYVLGFQPNKHKGPGAYHKIKLKVARKGARVSHRPGYYERAPLSAQAPLQRQFEVAQLVVAGGKQNDLGVSTLCMPFPVKGERQAVALLVQVPAAALEWSRRRPTSLEVYAYAVAEDGTVKDNVAQLARLEGDRVAQGPGDTRGISLVATLMVPPGRYTIRTLVVERESGSTGIQLHDITVPAYDERGGFLLPPMVVDDAGQWLMVGGVRHGAGPQDPMLFEAGGKQYVPRTSFEVQAGVAHKLMLVSFESTLPGDPAADLQVRSSVTDRDGRAVAPGLLRIDKVYRQDGRRTFLLGYTPDKLEVGEYTLRVALGEAGSRLESYSLLRMRAN